MSMANLQRMAQQMQQEMLRVQAELEDATVDGSAGGGVVRATVTGKQELVSVTIDPSAVDPADVEMLQDLVVAAVNDALARLARAGRIEDGGGDRRPAPAGDVGPTASCRPSSSSPSPGSSRRSRVCPGSARRPPSGSRSTCSARPDAEARQLAAALVAVRDQVVFCERCFNISDAPLCAICRDPARDQRRLCVVEEPLDVLALERTGEFKGLYHVLHGAISPIDGIGPDRLRIRELLARVGGGRGSRRAVRGGHPRHQPDPRGRGDGDVPRRAPRGRASASSAGSPGGSRSAATSSTPTR